MKIAYATFSFIFMVLIAAPGLQMAFNYLPENRLQGVEHKLDFPRATIQEYSEGTFQKALEDWFGASFGFRGYLVRTDNQINYSLFRTVTSDYATGILLGKKNFLFEKNYVDAYNHTNMLSTPAARGMVRRVKKLQDLLAARGIAFLLLISPSKAEMFSEYLKESYINPAVQKGTPSNYLQFKQALDGSGINLFDSTELIASMKSTAPYPLFTKGGTHWSLYSACLVTDRLITEFEKLLKKQMVHIDCSDVELSDVPRNSDRDLADLTNLWFEDVFFHPVAYPKSRSIKTGNDFRPEALFIGDSFLWNIFEYLDRHRIYSERDMLYYYKTLYRYRGRHRKGKVVPLDKANMNWEKLLFSKDLVVIEVNQSHFNELGFGFVEETLTKLGVPTETDSQLLAAGESFPRRPE